MQHQHLVPVAPQERIQTIDIIRGMALLGILVINFTVDSSNINPNSGFGDQFVYWSVRLLMDDRFQSMYCFLFGLGFALQMQRAEARSSLFYFAFLRRMIALYLIMIGIHILTDEAYYVLPYYAMVGVLLLPFWKVSTKLLPLLAISFFLLSWTRNAIVTSPAELVTKELIGESTSIDSTALDKLVGVYEDINEKNPTVIFREGKYLYGQGRGNKIRLLPLSDTVFALEKRTAKQYFNKDSGGRFVKFTVRDKNGRELLISNKTTKSLAEGFERLEELRKRKAESGRPSYSEFVKKTAVKDLERIKYWSWNDFFWNNNYTIGYILVLFLFGMYTGKRKIFNDIPKNRKLLINVFKWGMITGGAGISFYAGFEIWNHYNNIKWDSYSVRTRTFIYLPWEIGRIVMGLAYISGLALILENGVWKKRLALFAPVGRMGLTSYILHLFAYMIIFDRISWFWGLEDKIGCLYRLLLAIPVYIILYFFSRWWLKYFKQGPFEWLWRSMTYLKFQPMRIKAENKTGDEKI